MKQHPLPYFSERKTPVDILVLHCAAHSTESMIESFKKYEVSSHYIIGYEGEITQLVDEDKCAWHAGRSFWRGHESINTRSIGIEIANETLGQSPYNDEQIETLLNFLPKIIKKYNIKPENIVGHSDIAPLRKPDPGMAFPWKLLAKHGIGLWYGKEQLPENDVKKLLDIIGYDTRTEEALIASCYAFRRHFLPEEVTIDNNVKHLVDHVYPSGDKTLKTGKKFLQTLKAIAKAYNN